MLSVILAIAGIVLLVWRKRIAQFLFEIQLPGYKFMYGTFLNLERPWFRRLYDWWVIVAGVSLLLMATYFGFLNI